MSKTAEMVSILSPVYNEADHLDEMIASVQAQSHRQFELIVVDDGSSDASSDKVRAAQEQDPRIKSISGGKRGKVESFNEAFRRSSGDTIVLLAGDDLLPPDSLLRRARSIDEARRRGAEMVALYARLRTFSENPKYDGLIIPRRPGKGGRSGGTLALSRPLAERIFPIPSHLVAEDVWIASLAESLAETLIELPDIVLHYRIHAGNSNPRHQDFEGMNSAMHQRLLVYAMLAASPDLAIPNRHRLRFAAMAEIEEARYSGDTVRVLSQRGAPIVDRVRAASMSNATLFGLRNRLFRLLSGW